MIFVVSGSEIQRAPPPKRLVPVGSLMKFSSRTKGGRSPRGNDVRNISKFFPVLTTNASRKHPHLLYLAQTHSDAGSA